VQLIALINNFLKTFLTAVKLLLKSFRDKWSLQKSLFIAATKTCNMKGFLAITTTVAFLGMFAVTTSAQRVSGVGTTPGYSNSPQPSTPGINSANRRYDQPRVDYRTPPPNYDSK
jgi:hypothetical protein